MPCTAHPAPDLPERAPPARTPAWTPVCVRHLCASACAAYTSNNLNPDTTSKPTLLSCLEPVCAQAYDVAKVQGILGQLKDEAADIMLFLKSVERIEVRPRGALVFEVITVITDGGWNRFEVLGGGE